MPLESDMKDPAKTNALDSAAVPKLSLRQVSKVFEARRGSVRALEPTISTCAKASS